jgi:PAS domain S-box-containing protein
MPPASLPSDATASPRQFAAPEALLRDLLAISLTTVSLLRPLYSPTGELHDFALEYLNPAAQRMTGLPEQPSATATACFPDTLTNGVFAMYCRVFTTGADEYFEFNYQADGFDSYFRVAARRSGDLLIVSFINTADYPRTAIEEALRASGVHQRAAHAATEDRRAELEALFEQVPLALSLCSGPQHIIELANPRMVQIWGRPLAGLRGRPHFEALPDLAGQGFEAVFDRVYQTGQPYHFQEQLVFIEQAQQHYEGYFNITYQPAYTRAGHIGGIIAAAVEVTDQVRIRHKMQALNEELEARVATRTQQVQAARAEAEMQRTALQRLFMQAPAGIFILTGPDLVFEFVNPTYQRLIGGRSLLGRPFLEALPEMVATPSFALLRQVYETGETHEGQDVRFAVSRRIDGVGEERYFSFVYQARRDEQQRIDGIISFGFEVTEQVRARQAVEASAQQMRLVTDALPVLISYLDHAQIYRFANRAYEAWFHRSPAQMVGQHPRQVVGEAAYQQVRANIERALAGELVEYDAHMVYEGNLVKHVHGSFIPDVQEGRVVGFFALIADVTAQVEARQAAEASAQQAVALATELHAANEQLTRTNVDLDTFIYTASHDLKAPIANIEGLLLLLRKQLPAEVRQAGLVPRVLAMMQGAVERFQLTIAQLTDLAKLQHAHTQPAEEVDLRAVVEAVRLDLLPLLDETQAQLTIDLDGCAVVSFAPQHLRSLLYNLLSNAIKYRHPARRPQVQLRGYRTPATTVLEVQDNGLGLTPDQQSKLFHMFQRLHDHVPGSGVGLFMVKRIVENAGGLISVQSEAGVGTTFLVTLPA